MTYLLPLPSFYCYCIESIIVGGLWLEGLSTRSTQCFLVQSTSFHMTRSSTWEPHCLIRALEYGKFAHIFHWNVTHPTVIKCHRTECWRLERNFSYAPTNSRSQLGAQPAELWHPYLCSRDCRWSAWTRHRSQARLHRPGSPPAAPPSPRPCPHPSRQASQPTERRDRNNYSDSSMVEYFPSL